MRPVRNRRLGPQRRRKLAAHAAEADPFVVVMVCAAQPQGGFRRADLECEGLARVGQAYGDGLLRRFAARSRGVPLVSFDMPPRAAERVALSSHG